MILWYMWNKKLKVTRIKSNNFHNNEKKVGSNPKK